MVKNINLNSPVWLLKWLVNDAIVFMLIANRNVANLISAGFHNDSIGGRIELHNY
jgi:hypothetical protein